MTGRLFIASGMSVFGDRVRAAREASDLSQSELARAIGVSPQAIQAIEAGGVRRSKYLTELARVLKKPPAWLAGDEDSQLVTVDSPSRDAAVRGIVAAGLWQADSDRWGDETPVPASPDPRYARLPQIAYRVVGNSMNRNVSDGEYVICVDYAATPMPLREGDVVVAERHRAGEIERTVKTVRMGSQGPELWPNSNDPAHKKPLILSASEEDTRVEIVGLVVGYYRPA